MIQFKKTKQIFFCLLCLLLAGFLLPILACGSTAPVATPTRKPSATFAPTPTAFMIPFDQVGTHINERVIVQGYLATKAVFSCTSHTPKRCYIPFARTPDDEPEFLLSFLVSSVNASNTMKSLPENFKLSDMVFYTDDLQSVGDGDFVQLTGTVYTSESKLSLFEKGTPWIFVEKLELIP